MITDGGQNALPDLLTVYARYCQRFDVEPTVYWYQMGSVNRAWGVALTRAQIDVQDFDLTGGFDLTSLPNLVSTMRVGRYSLVDEIQQTPLLTLDTALPRTAGMPVLAR